MSRYDGGVPFRAENLKANVADMTPKYLFAAVLMLASPATADQKVEDALQEVVISYAKMVAGGVTCDLQFPKDARRRVVYAMATTGNGSSRAGELMDNAASAELRRIQAHCTDAIRNEHGNWIRSFERDFKLLSDSITF